MVIALALHSGVARTDNPARYPFSDLPAQLLLLHAFDGQRLTFNFPSWSLSAEMFCYVLFPLVAAITARRKALIVALFVLPALANSLYAGSPEPIPGPTGSTRAALSGRCPAFNLGVACYLYRDQIARWPVIPWVLMTALTLRSSCWARGFSPMTALVAIYVIALLAIQSDCAGHSTLFSKLGFDRLVVADLLLLHAAYPGRDVVLTFGSRLLFPSLPDARLILLPVAIAVLAAASVLSLRYFETPLRRYLDGRLRPPLRTDRCPCPRFLRRRRQDDLGGATIGRTGLPLPDAPARRRPAETRSSTPCAASPS